MIKKSSEYKKLSKTNRIELSKYVCGEIIISKNEFVEETMLDIITKEFERQYDNYIKDLEKLATKLLEELKKDE